ncbi:MAG: phosphate acetyltransferase [Coriobacteriales bacterium]|nr:phosphate acetyltransferase [Coriobacteriales bacterium]
MGNFLNQIKKRAQADLQTIVLPEGNDIRTIEAARCIADEGIANCVILGNIDKIRGFGINTDGLNIVDHLKSDKLEKYANLFYELRKHKGISLEDAKEQVKDESYFGTLMVKAGDADGLVSGAVHSTPDTLRPALQILKTAPGVSIVSAIFVIDVPNCEYGNNGLFVFGDSGLNKYPNSEELAQIGISSAHTYKDLIEDEPKVAFLSFSTYGSAKGSEVDLVREAVKLAQSQAPEFMMDGELQLDAAIVETVGKSKAPNSPVAGKANVLIFPNLDAGNIGYKLAQRLGKAEAYGPICQGIAMPVNDLSRGCSAQDIVGVVAITAVQSQIRKANL